MQGVQGLGWYRSWQQLHVEQHLFLFEGWRESIWQCVHQCVMVGGRSGWGHKHVFFVDVRVVEVVNG